MEHFAWYFFPFTNGARDGTLPTYARTTLVGQRSGPPRQNWAPCGAIWHTSSKGMPRHAHRRWALVRVCGVDVGDEFVGEVS